MTCWRYLRGRVCVCVSRFSYIYEERQLAARPLFMPASASYVSYVREKKARCNSSYILYTRVTAGHSSGCITVYLSKSTSRPGPQSAETGCVWYSSGHTHKQPDPVEHSCTPSFDTSYGLWFRKRRNKLQAVKTGFSNVQATVQIKQLGLFNSVVMRGGYVRFEWFFLLFSDAMLRLFNLTELKFPVWLYWTLIFTWILEEDPRDAVKWDNTAWTL